MNFKNQHPHTAIISTAIISTAIAGACSVAFSGCVPTTTPGAAPKFALYYQVSDLVDTERDWIKRWVQETGTTEVLLEQDYKSIKSFQDQHPDGSIFRLTSYTKTGSQISSQSEFTWTPTGSNPQPRKIYDSTSVGDITLTHGAWNQWSPDGKHLGERIGRNVYVATADGSAKKLIGTIDSNDVGPHDTWSPDGSKLAYVKNVGTIEVTDINTNAKTTFALSTTAITGLHWMADNRHIAVAAYNQNNAHTLIVDLQNPTVIEPGFINADNEMSSLFTYINQWSPAGDRVVQRRYNYGVYDDVPEIEYALTYADGRPNVSLRKQRLDALPDIFDLFPSWSHNGERMAYVKDADTDGDDDVVVTDKDGNVLQTFTNFGQVADVRWSWSPDDSKLLVTTNELIGNGDTTAKLITLANNSAVTLLETANLGRSEASWSPNSRYVVHNGFLADTATQPVSTIAIPLTLREAAWSADSGYVGFSSLIDDKYPISVINMNDTSTITEIAPQTTGRVYWSKPTE